jgi:hypothetical protein
MATSDHIKEAYNKLHDVYNELNEAEGDATKIMLDASNAKDYGRANRTVSMIQVAMGRTDQLLNDLNDLGAG